MQHLTRLIAEARKKGISGEQQIFNIIREYLQVLILKAIYQSKYGKGLSFMRGTCLRICHDLKRYSEDLDFALDWKIPKYSFEELNKTIVSFLKNTDFEVDLSIDEEKIVQKSFIRVSKVLHAFRLSPLKAQKIHVKIEVDTNPVKVSKNEVETFFVTKFDEIFPIIKHTDETMFAGKICAVFNSAYTKGRDFYDLIWYLNKKMGINFEYLNKALKQQGGDVSFQNKRELLHALQKKIESVKTEEIMKDIGRFLEDPLEEKWIQNYPAVFLQAAKRFET
ncbi:nucleotidyl transferase AbiEii/AbiGii toxin family protein [Candidatus Peregrinibacteria bacterium]|nr:nucleotidyl transferase AbiEii/AbiGii toxin family protein [Candidatus Peregrinibacteria bacterium]